MTEVARIILRSCSEYPTPGPHGQMELSVKEKCGELYNKPDLKAADVKELLDECACYSLCTDFVMAILDRAWKELLEIDDEG